MRRALMVLCVAGACASAHAAGSGSWVLDKYAPEHRAACLQEAKALVDAATADPMTAAKAAVAGSAASIGDFRLLSSKPGHLQCASMPRGAQPDERAFCGVGGRLTMCASVLQHKMLTDAEQQAAAQHTDSSNRWYVRKHLPATPEAVRIALYVAREDATVNIRKLSMADCSIKGLSGLQQRETGSNPALGGLSAEHAAQMNVCQKRAADDGGVIKAVSVIHPKYAGFLAKSDLDQENALVYLSRVVANEQDDAKKHPLYPIFERAVNGQ